MSILKVEHYCKLGFFSYSAYIKEVLRDKVKFIVFAYHKVMLDAISGCLTKQNIDFVRIDGSTRSDLRSKYIDRFQSHKSCQVALLSLKGILLPFAINYH